MNTFVTVTNTSLLKISVMVKQLTTTLVSIALKKALTMAIMYDGDTCIDTHWLKTTMIMVNTGLLTTVVMVVMVSDDVIIM